MRSARRARGRVIVEAGPQAAHDEVERPVHVSPLLAYPPYEPRLSNAALPPVAVVFTVSVRSKAKRVR